MVRCNLTFACLTVALALLSLVQCDKLRFCAIDGKGSFKKSAKYCPLLDSADSKVECVIGADRLDCLRRILKGKVDFSVFTPEDLVAAANSDIDVLLTNELRFTKDDNEYAVVAVINDASGIKSKHDLKDKRFCHPGYGYETDWTKILSNFLEASVVPQSCEPSLTLTENRISSSSKFFKSACKAGPWVHDPVLDSSLKRKYPNLCALCDLPFSCSQSDKYWGRRGPLFCLTDGVGDISWARLDDVEMHFGITPGAATTTPDGFSFLCADGRIMPVNSTNPCVWVVKPWPVVASKRTSAKAVQEIVTSLTHRDKMPWKTALLDLIETYHVTMKALNPIEGIESFFDRATGFLSANSFTGCHPPRTIRLCTTSNLENAKCGWLRESAAVYGIEPDVDCIKADNTTHCMQALTDNVVDVVMVPPNLVQLAVSKYNMKTVFYETVNEDDKYITVAVVKSESGIMSLADLKGKKACFPSYDGIAWNTAVHALDSRSLLSTCPFTAGMADFFGDSCVPSLPQSESSLKTLCKGDIFAGEEGALKCLNDGIGDVAFVSRNSLAKYMKEAGLNKVKLIEFRIICPSELKPCHLSWSPPGQGMTSANKTDLWVKDTLDVFQQLDILFGKDYKSFTSPYTMFGIFDGRSNVLFHDATVKIKNVPNAKNTDKMPRQYENILASINKCTIASSSSAVIASSLIIIINVICLQYFKTYLQYG